MIDQLRKKKFLEQLSGRLPAQVEPTVKAEGGDDTLLPEIEINADYGGDELLADADESISGRMPLAKSRQDKQIDNVQSDAMVGASQALIGLLSGNHNRIAMGFDKGNKYVQDRRTEDRKDLASLVKTNQNGKPIYTPSIEAADMEAYIAPTKSGSANNKTMLREFENIDNPNVTVLAYVDPNTMEVTDSRSNQKLDLNAFQPKQQIKQITTKDQYGTISNNVVRRAGAPLTKGQLEEGEGAPENIPVTKIRQAEKVATEYTKKAQKYQDDLTSMDMAEKVLSDKFASPQEKKLAIGQIMKSVEQRMTDADRDEYKGEASMFVNIGNKLDMLTDNELPPQLEFAFKKAARNLKNKIGVTSGKYRKSAMRAYSGGDKKLDEYIGQRLEPVGGGTVYQPTLSKKSFKQPFVEQRSIGPNLQINNNRVKEIQAELDRREGKR